LRIIPFLALLFFISSCSSEQGSRVVGDQLSVYYDLPQDESLAEKIAIYWRDQGFLTSQKQDVRIVHVHDGFQLLLIENENVMLSELPFGERKLLNDLKNDLQKNIFQGNLEIVICNTKFEPKYTIN